MKPQTTSWNLRPEQIARFHASYFMEPNCGCWIWTGTVEEGGYGRFTIAKQKLASAHRISYFLHKGEIPSGMQLDHLCRVRCCVNPDHLEAVTNQVNAARGEAGYHHKLKTHCKRGHPFDDENTIWINSGKHRRCRECQKSYLPKESPHD
jgi:hypothetical protein